MLRRQAQRPLRRGDDGADDGSEEGQPRDVRDDVPCHRHHPRLLHRHDPHCYHRAQGPHRGGHCRVQTGD